MQKWENLVFWVDNEGTVSLNNREHQVHVSNLVEDMGAQGWEVVAAVASDGRGSDAAGPVGHWLYLKRPSES